MTPTTEKLPEEGLTVIGYADRWVDSDYNPKGMRECFRTNGNVWLSAAWNNSYESWDVEFGAPDFWQDWPDIS